MSSTLLQGSSPPPWPRRSSERAGRPRSAERASWLLALGLVLAACGRERPKLVIWIEVDTLRADALGCYGNTMKGENGVAPSPHIDALARDGLRFENAYSAAPWTIPSLVTQLSGRWPWEHGQMRLLETVPEGSTPLVPAMRSRGWRTAGVMTNFIATAKQGFSNGFEVWDDSFAKGHEGSTSHAALHRLLAMADDFAKDPKEGMFLFAWLFEPHYRYESHEGHRFGPGYGALQGAPYTGSLTGKEELDDLLRRRFDLDNEDRAFLRGNYQSEVAWLDHALGELVDGLKKRGLLDGALIVLTADHGEEILDRGWIGHSVTLHEELVHVPLIVRLPKGMAESRRGKTIEHPVSLIDLPATLVDLATGTEPDHKANELGHSRSLAPAILEGRNPDRRWLYLHTDFVPVLQSDVSSDKAAHQWGVIDAGRRLKWIVDQKVVSGERPRGYLFDLAQDPSEDANLAEDEAGEKTARTMERLRGLVREPLDGRRGAPLDLPEEPWTPRRADMDGAGPALLEGRH